MKNYTVEPITRSEAYPWIMKKHYAHRMPPISFVYGLFNLRNLIGVVTYGSPPSSTLCSGVCGEKNRERVLELNRLCIENNKKNAASFFIGASLKLLSRPKIIISYADTSRFHVGYVYQATNWFYTGKSARRTEKYDPQNKNTHSRTLTEDKDFYHSLPSRDRPQKHRYVYFLGTKKEKKEMLASLKYPILPYPKGESKKYDASFEPQTQMRMF